MRALGRAIFSPMSSSPDNTLSSLKPTEQLEKIDKLLKEQARPFNLLEEPVKIDLGTGVQYDLVFTLGMFKRLKRKLGRPLISRNGGLLDLDEDLLPELILAGISDKAGNPPEGITIETFDELPASAIGYLVEKFSQAYLQFIPPLKKERAATIDAANR